MGGADTSHKKVDKSRSFILNLYYTNKVRRPLSLLVTGVTNSRQTVLFLFCALNELFFIALYLLSFSSPFLSPSLLQVSNNGTASTLQPGSPAASTRLFFANPYSAGALEYARANKMDSTFPWIIAGISLPVMAGKQIINVVQLVKASRWLAEGDIEMRRAAGLPRKQKQK